MYSFTSPKPLTGQAVGSLSTDGNKVCSEASLRCTLPGHVAAVYPTPTSSTFGARSSMRIPGGRPPGVKPNNQSFRRKCIGIQDSSRNGTTLDYNCILQGSTFIGRRGTLARLDSDNTGETPAGGRHFLFDNKWTNDEMCSKYELRDETFQRSTGFIPPLPRDYQVHRSGNLHRYPCLKERSFGPGQPLTLGCCEGYDLTSGPAILLPSVVSLTGRHSLSIDGYKHRPRVGNRACSLFTIAAHQKTQTYPDPVSGASASFIQRLSEISCLEGETVRQEKIKKVKKSRKQESNPNPPSLDHMPF